ncbi:hypothetical protein [Apibacter sp.]|uniref:hypothetical protein n=1 Tax=Apibacter sp. TaxID=2023709 RepID=UPI0025F7ACEE|nr:hypothetical protein [Apibacter sp.]MCT6869744.1 hypothetical protein [Apibacter sp.]
MINYLNDINKTLFDFINHYGNIILVTVISMVARSIYKGISIGRLFLKIPISTIIGIVIGMLLEEFSEESNNTILVICMITGAYTGEILEGIEQLLKWTPLVIKKIICKKLDIDDKDH